MKNKKANQRFPCFPRIAQKRGWLRILEATIAIMLVSGVLLVMSSRSMEKGDIDKQVYLLQKEILMDVSLDGGLRQNVLAGNIDELNNFADAKIPDEFDFKILICDLESVVGCGLIAEDYQEIGDKDIYVEEVVIAGVYDTYDPKKVRVFVWEAG